MRNLAVAMIAAFVIYGEYLVWIKSPMSQIVAICDDFRALNDAIAAQRRREPFSVINEASAASLEPIRLIDKAVCDGLPEAVDVEESNPRAAGDNIWCKRPPKGGPCDYCRSKCLGGSAGGNAIRIRGWIYVVEPRGFEPLPKPCNRSM